MTGIVAITIAHLDPLRSAFKFLINIIFTFNFYLGDLYLFGNKTLHVSVKAKRESVYSELIFIWCWGRMLWKMYA